MSDRRARVTRETEETTIELTLAVDGSGSASVDTGIGFLDHMLTSLAAHGLFDLTVQAAGDLEIDEHHTVEDVGIVLGSAFDEALGDRSGIVRFADRSVPLDEALASVVVDVSGRPGYHWNGSFSQEQVGAFTAQLAEHFWESVAMHAGMTVHATVAGNNAHHEIEALFKAFARALDDATRIDDRRADAPSTKGSIE